MGVCHRVGAHDRTGADIACGCGRNGECGLSYEDAFVPMAQMVLSRSVIVFKSHNG